MFFCQFRITLPQWSSSTRRQMTGRNKTVPAYLRNKDEKLMFGGVIETKYDKKKRERQQRKGGKALSSVGTGAPDSEAFWLSNSPAKNLKVFRKTSSGKYKEVDKVKIEEKEEQGKVTITSENERKILMPEIMVNASTAVSMLASPRNLGMLSMDENKWAFPSVTRILSTTMSDESKTALERWKQQMIAELGEEGFTLLNKEQLSFGARFHSCVRKFLDGSNPELDDDLGDVWRSIQNVLPHVTQVKLLETGVFHSKLKYRGVVDCVASYQNIPAVIEWKVSQKSKPLLSSTYDAPVQLSAYVGALSYDTNHKMNLRNGVVVVAYKDGAPAEVFRMDEQSCRRHWLLWLKRLQLYWHPLQHN